MAKKRTIFGEYYYKILTDRQLAEYFETPLKTFLYRKKKYVGSVNLKIAADLINFVIWYYEIYGNKNIELG